MGDNFMFYMLSNYKGIVTANMRLIVQKHMVLGCADHCT